MRHPPSRDLGLTGPAELEDNQSNVANEVIILLNTSITHAVYQSLNAAAILLSFATHAKLITHESIFNGPFPR